MPNNFDYQMLPSTDICAGDVLVESVSQEQTQTLPDAHDNESPPPYDAAETHVIIPDIGEEQPPVYTDIVKLPSYNEAQNIEEPIENDEQSDETNPSIFLYWLRHNNNELQVDDDALGSDIGFLFFFLLSFVFNWLGFFITYCFARSYSSHYGAISGFGLSLVKWAFIMKKSHYVELNPWILYLFVLLGWVIFLRGIFSYIQLKRYVYSNRSSVQHNEEFMG